MADKTKAELQVELDAANARIAELEALLAARPAAPVAPVPAAESFPEQLTREQYAKLSSEDKGAYLRKHGAFAN